MSPSNRGRGGRAGYQGKGRGGPSQSTRGGNKGNHGSTEQPPMQEPLLSPPQQNYIPCNYPPPGAYGAVHMPQHIHSPPSYVPQLYPYNQHLSPPFGQMPPAPPRSNDAYDSSGQRVVYTEMAHGPRPSSTNGGVPPQGYNGGHVQWQQGRPRSNGGSSAGSGPDGENYRYAQYNGDQYAWQHNNYMGETIVLSRQQYDMLMHELQYLRNTVWTYQTQGAHHPPQQYPHTGNYYQRNYAQQHDETDHQSWTDNEDQSTVEGSAAVEDNIANTETGIPQIVLSPESHIPQDGIDKLIADATEKTPGRTASFYARRISYPVASTKAHKFDGQNKASFNGIMEHASRPPSPLAVAGMAKISPVPTYDQLHAGKTRPSGTDSGNNTKSDEKPAEEAPVTEQVFVDQIKEVEAQIATNKNSQKNKKKQSKAVTTRRDVAKDEVKPGASQDSTVVSRTADNAEPEKPMLAEVKPKIDEDLALEATLTPMKNRERSSSKPFKFNPRASNFSAEFSADFTAEPEASENTYFSEYTAEHYYASQKASELAQLYPMDEVPTYSSLNDDEERAKRGYPVFKKKPNHTPVAEGTLKIPAIIPIPFDNELNTEKTRADPIVDEKPSAPKVPARYTTGMSWADDSSEDDEVNARVSVDSEEKKSEVELVISTGGPTTEAVPHIGMSDINWIPKSDEESGNSLNASDAETEGTLRVKVSQGKENEKIAATVAVPSVSVSSYDDKSKLLVAGEKKADTTPKVSGASTSTSKSFKTTLTIHRSGQATPISRSGCATPEAGAKVEIEIKKVAKADVSSSSGIIAKEVAKETHDKLAPVEEEWTTVTPKSKKKYAVRGNSAPGKNNEGSGDPLVSPSEVSRLLEDEFPDLKRNHSHPRGYYRKLYLSDIPKSVTYESFVKLIRGGLIDDMYISGLSPDYVRHHSKSGKATSEDPNRPWFGYITFYSARGAKRFIDYLNSIDNGPSPKTHGMMTVAFMMVEGARIPVQLRDNDQRDVAPDIVEAVEKHNATRVLTFAFGKGLARTARREKGLMEPKVTKTDVAGVKWDWAKWQKSFAEKNGEAALAHIATSIQVWNNSPVVYVDNMKLVATKGIKGEECYKVQVALLRISAAEKVKGHLECHRDFVDHCVIAYTPDPCETRDTNVQKSTALDAVTNENDAPASSAKAAPKKKSKKKKPEVDDKQVFPSLPGSPPKEAKPVGWTASAKIKAAPTSSDSLPVSAASSVIKSSKKKKGAAQKTPVKPVEEKKPKATATIKPEVKKPEVKKPSPTPSLSDENEFPSLGSPKNKGG